MERGAGVLLDLDTGIDDDFLLNAEAVAGTSESESDEAAAADSGDDF